ncbi:MAG: leucine-rich repeat domain-containing protein [bacterium]
MKKWVQSFTVLCLIALAFVLAPRMVLADDHGTTGGCTWTYEEEKRLLTISGTGAMADYGVESATTSTWEAPWHKYCQMLETIHIEDGVWYIGEYAFAGCFGVEDVAFGDSVQRIGAHAFEGCSSFECPWFPNSLRVIDDYAFAGCTNMFTVSFPDTGVVSIGAYAFVNTPSLTGVRLPDSLQTIGEYAFGYVLDPNGTGLVRNTKFARITSASKVAKEYAD